MGHKPELLRPENAVSREEFPVRFWRDGPEAGASGV